MPIISAIGRRSWRMRLLIGSIYLLLIGGAVTMVYPFLLMIAGSSKSAADSAEQQLIPSFLQSDLQLQRKSYEAFFNESLGMYQYTCHDPAISFRHLEAGPGASQAYLNEWFKFQAELPDYCYELSSIASPRSRGCIPANLRKFKNELYEEVDGDIAKLRTTYDCDFHNWNSLYIQPEHLLMRGLRQSSAPLIARYRRFKSESPLDQRYYFSPEGFYRLAYLRNLYGRTIEEYNEAHGSQYETWEDVVLHRSYPYESGEQEQADWLDFVRNHLNLLWLRADETGAAAFRAYLEAKYTDVALLNERYETSHATFSAVPLPEKAPEQELARADWTAFMQELHLIPLDAISIWSVDTAWRDHLQALGSLDDVNQQLGTAKEGWTSFSPPQRSAIGLYITTNDSEWKQEFLTRNFRSVSDYIILHGRGLWNTFVYCGLAVLLALIVNPLAAYALSRYKPPNTSHFLLFLMMTMAFPPMVTQIPIFLMLRELHLLNSFWALVLPGMANGYSIFLLKGFFDSLPEELYESAEIDGAGELRIFWSITMSLSRPILAVIALNAFTIAYGNFMMALLICQDEKMWTLMPWLYQLQQRSGPGVVFSSLLIAAIPTFLLFSFCQNIIMRGIVVPVEK